MRCMWCARALLGHQLCVSRPECLSKQQPLSVTVAPHTATVPRAKPFVQVPLAISHLIAEKNIWSLSTTTPKPPKTSPTDPQGATPAPLRPPWADKHPQERPRRCPDHQGPWQNGREWGCAPPASPPGGARRGKGKDPYPLIPLSWAKGAAAPGGVWKDWRIPPNKKKRLGAAIPL